MLDSSSSGLPGLSGQEHMSYEKLKEVLNSLFILGVQTGTTSNLQLDMGKL